MLVPLAQARLAGTGFVVTPRLLLLEAILSPFNGLAAWLVWRRIDVGLERKRAGLRRWGWMLLGGALVPATWTSFGPGPALAMVLLCAAATVWTGRAFRRLQPAAALLLIPYAVWLLATATIVASRF